MTEDEIAEKWVAIAKAERARTKKRDGGPVPPNPKNQYNAPKGPSKYDPRRDKSHSYNPEKYEEICRLRKEGKSNREIGRILKVSDTSIRYWRKRYNIS